MKPGRNTISNFWRQLVGSPDVLPLETRIFNAVCIITFGCLLTSIIFNYIIGATELTMLMLSVCLLSCFFFYNSRLLNRTSFSVVLYGIVGNLLLGINYFYNSGINGPTLLVFVLTTFMIAAITPVKQHVWWISSNCMLVAGLVIYEYLHPGIIPITYPDTISRFFDFIYSYIVVVFLIILVTRFIRSSYNNERLQAEEKARQLEEANDTKNKLFSILAHDLRSPLNSIQGYLQALSELKLSEQEKYDIEKELLSKTKNTDQMLGNLLSWTKAQMEHVTAMLQPVNLKDALQATLQIQESIALEKKIKFVNNINPSIYVVADHDMLQLVIRNVINNAIKFTSRKGKIEITTRIEESRCIISVHDNGMGISKEQQPNIFSLKVKAANGTKNEKGVGLGLVLCKEFTELQGGKIWYESIPGQGTSFHISLELA